MRNPSSPRPHWVGAISPSFALLNVSAPASAELTTLLQDLLRYPLRNRGRQELTLGDVLRCTIRSAPYAVSVVLTPVTPAPTASWCGRLKQAVLRTTFQAGVHQYLQTLRQNLDQPDVRVC